MRNISCRSGGIGNPQAQEKLEVCDFKGDNYNRVIVTWEATDNAREVACKQGIQFWVFLDLQKYADAHPGIVHTSQLASWFAFLVIFVIQSVDRISFTFSD